MFYVEIKMHVGEATVTFYHPISPFLHYISVSCVTQVILFLLKIVFSNDRIRKLSTNKNLNN